MSLYQLNTFEFYYVMFFVFVIGACFGSFSNVLILRAFTGESVVLPPSKCPYCKNKLKWYHNIPIFSFLFLRGKCGFCKEKISIQYPIVELIIALLFVAFFLKFDLTLKTLFMCLFGVMLVVLSATDIKEQVIFDGHAYILGGLGLIYNFFDIGKSGLGVYDLNLFAHSFSVNKSFVFALLGVLAGVLLMELLALVGKVLVGQRAFGEGDSFIMGALGAIFGFAAVPVIVFVGGLLQAFLVLPVMIKKFIEKKNYALLISMSVLIVSIVLFYVLTNFELLDNIVLLWGYFLFLVVLTIYFSFKMISSARENAENLTMMPFGPPLLFVALVLMFI